MKFSIFGYTIVVAKSAKVDFSAYDDFVQKRRMRAKKVLEVCHNSDSVIERIKAVGQLGPSVFPELETSERAPIDGRYPIVSLKAAKEWVESAFVDNGKGEPS